MWRPIFAGTAAAVVLTGVAVTSAEAASSRFCEGGRWVLTQQGDTVLARGRHVQFDIDTTTMTVRNWTLTGAANPGRLVQSPTMIFAEKAPLHGAILTQTERLRNDRGDLVFVRTNGIVSVKIQAKDCAQGGIFQMEIEREDDPSTRVRHTLAPATFYFDNPNFRAREGDVVPFNNAAGEAQDIVIAPRVNFGSDTSAALVGRDSPQAATRIPHPTCTNQIPTRTGGPCKRRALRRRERMGRSFGRTHGSGHGRRFDRGRAALDLLCQGLPGAESGARWRRGAWTPVPGAGGVPSPAQESITITVPKRVTNQM